MHKEKEKAVDLGSSFDDPDFDNISGGSNMADDKQTFDVLVSQYGVDRAIARGLRAKMNPPADGKVKEADFVKALKEFAGGTPK